MSDSSASKLLLSVALTLALAVSLTYATWFGTLELNVMSTTGEVNLTYENITCEEYHELGGKNVGSCTCSHDSSTGVDRLEVTLLNGYPGYKCVVGFDVVNTGTIPVIGPFYNGVELPEGLNITFNPPAVEQLHPGDRAHYELVVEVLQSAQEKSEYTVILDITYIQWNEVSGLISGYVWNDLNGDGSWDAGEPAMEGVLVRLMGENSIIASAYTGSNGYYYFLVQSGRFRISPVLPLGYEFTTSSEIVVVLGVGESSANNNFGAWKHTITFELNASSDFRQTDVNFNICPPQLGAPLDQLDGQYVVRAEVPKGGEWRGKVRSVQPGAFYYVLQLTGSNLTQIDVAVNYEYQFNIHDGQDGMIRVYVVNKSTGCVIQGAANYLYNVNNTLNVATVNITLSSYLTGEQAVLIYIKFKPTTLSPKEPNGLIGHLWETLDRQFGLEYNVETNNGATSGSATLNIVEK